VSRGGRTGVRTFVRPGIRAHAMKFNVDAQARRRLSIALQTLDDHADAVRLAISLQPEPISAAHVIERTRAALKTLVYGPSGEFR
jgi:hypothetical protein